MRLVVLSLLVSAQAFAGHLQLSARSQVVDPSDRDGGYHEHNETLQWDSTKTAIVVCDMWDKHWCAGATSRVAEMAPRMNEVLTAARNRGVLIIHCPSDTLEFYKNTPQRLLAQAAPQGRNRSAAPRLVPSDGRQGTTASDR